MSRDSVTRIAIGAWTALCAGVLALGLSGGIATVAFAVFILLCPGVAWSRLFRLGDLGDVVATGLAIGIALAVVVAQTMALASWWSPAVAFAVLAGITLLGLALTPTTGEPADT